MFIGNQNFLTCLFIFLTLCDSFIYLTNVPRYHTEKYLLDINLLTTLEVEDYVRNSKDGNVPIIIPIGATEQHGPTGLIGTDWITSLAVARGVCEECNVLLGPVINTGMSMHHCGFAGSLSLRPSTLVNLICDVVLSLRQSTNITHFFFINGHGGNVLPMKLALSILKEKFNSSHVKTTSRFFGLSKKVVSIERPVKVNCHVNMISWYANKESQELARSLYGDELGQHATPGGVRLLYIYKYKYCKV
jgi:creatinine amidohydrolase